MLGGTRAARRRWRSCLAVMTALTAGLAAAGCGGDEASTAQEEVRIQAATQPSQEFAGRLANLLRTTKKPAECLELNTIAARSFTRFPCPPPKPMARSMASFEIVDSDEYGTGAVVDYKSGEAKDGAALILFVAPNREWGISRFGMLTEPSVGTSDATSREGFDTAVDDYLAAVRDRDCKAYMEVAVTDSSDAKAVCKSAFAGTEGLADRLEASSDPAPVYEGGNRTFGFYTVETPKPKPRRTTVSVIRTESGGEDVYLVMDIAPSPTEAVLRRLQRQLDRQRKQGKTTPGATPNPNSMIPGEGGTGRKAD
jgi:hypothetical protein